MLAQRWHNAKPTIKLHIRRARSDKSFWLIVSRKRGLEVIGSNPVPLRKQLAASAFGAKQISGAGFCKAKYWGFDDSHQTAQIKDQAEERSASNRVFLNYIAGQRNTRTSQTVNMVINTVIQVEQFQPSK